jgi:multidrug transporter EmrE-like cation transporter
MNSISFALVLLGVTLNAMAQSLLKLGANRLGTLDWSGQHMLATALRIMTEWPFLVGFGCYGVSVLVWILALTRVPVTVAYPALSLGYIMNGLIAYFWLGETLDMRWWGGIALICAGVALIAKPAA